MLHRIKQAAQQFHNINLISYQRESNVSEKEKLAETLKSTRAMIEHKILHPSSSNFLLKN